MISFRFVLTCLLLTLCAPVPALAYDTVGDCNCPTDFTPNTWCQIETENNLCYCDNNETGYCSDYQVIDVSPDPNPVPEMSEYLAILFVVAAGFILFRARKRNISI